MSDEYPRRCVSCSAEGVGLSGLCTTCQRDVDRKHVSDVLRLYEGERAVEAVVDLIQRAREGR